MMQSFPDVPFTTAVLPWGMTITLYPAGQQVRMSDTCVMVTVCVAVPSFPEPSSAVHVTVVVPTW